jgi:TetR/AcrR family transcriptional regulator of autoinduction and epiphytic fitness
MQGLVKGFAFWPQITLGQPSLTAAQQKQVAESAVDMFLAYYAQP